VADHGELGRPDPRGAIGPLRALSQDQASPAARAGRPVRDGVALGLAVGLSGLAFGAAAVTAGLSPWQACALSLLAYTGASQFALAGTIASGGSLLAGTAGAILLGSRNALYSVRLADLLQVRGLRRLVAAQGVTDESTAIALAQADQAAARTGFRATFASLYLAWNLATLLGALGTGTLGSPQSFGLDVIGPAAFLALIWPRLRAGGTERAVAALGATIALATTPLLPPGAPVILAATAALAGALSRPPGTSPVATGPAATSPAATGPAGTGPAGTGPAATSPAVTGPAGTGPAGT
jgi:predicted branched-subunit amino acid permease